jgi:hypothetical protein
VALGSGVAMAEGVRVSAGSGEFWVLLDLRGFEVLGAAFAVSGVGGLLVFTIGHLGRNPLHGSLDRCIVGPCMGSKDKKLIRGEERFMLRVPIGQAHGRLAPSAFWRTQSMGRLWSRVVDLDSFCLLAHNLPRFLQRRRSWPRLCACRLVSESIRHWDMLMSC